MSRSLVCNLLRKEWRTIAFQRLEGNFSLSKTHNVMQQRTLACRILCGSRYSTSAEGEKGVQSVQPKEEKQKKDEEPFNPRATAPRYIDKKVLVWMKRYPSEEAIPTFVSNIVINTARDKFRVYVSCGLIVIAFSGCVMAAVLGKRQAARGDTLFNRTMKKYNHQMPSQHMPSEK